MLKFPFDKATAGGIKLQAHPSKGNKELPLEKKVPSASDKAKLMAAAMSDIDSVTSAASSAELLLEQQSWYRIGLLATRSQVEGMLKGSPAGTFIIRKSSHEGSFVLSVRAPSGTMLNARLIPNVAGGVTKYRLGEEGTELYESIIGMVDLFTKEAHLVDKHDGAKFCLYSESSEVSAKKEPVAKKKEEKAAATVAAATAAVGTKRRTKKGTKNRRDRDECLPPHLAAIAAKKMEEEEKAATAVVAAAKKKEEADQAAAAAATGHPSTPIFGVEKVPIVSLADSIEAARVRSPTQLLS